METHKHSLVDELMILTAHGLQLPKSKRDLAEQRYHSVGRYLEKETSPFYGVDIDIYAQGSMAIGTTVKPQQKEEYDVDLVLQMGMPPFQDDPIALLDTLEHYLKGNGNYDGIVERRNRCVCLNYAGDFHLDIIPAVPYGWMKQCDDCVVVPDREMSEWSPSNPLGFAQWFNLKAFEKQYFQKVAECRVHPVPGEEPSEQKPPLKRVVQLLKRHRDVYFNGNKKTPSIILTTLAGEASEYLGSEYNSVSDLFLAVLVHIKNRVDAASPSQLVVTNPTNPDEIFSEKWKKHPERYRRFVEWVAAAISDLIALKKTKDRDEAIYLLQRMFGERSVNTAVRDHAFAVSKAREAGVLGVSSGTGIITSVSSGPDRLPVKRHTFYGDRRVVDIER